MRRALRRPSLENQGRCVAQVRPEASHHCQPARGASTTAHQTRLHCGQADRKEGCRAAYEATPAGYCGWCRTNGIGTDEEMDVQTDAADADEDAVESGHFFPTYLTGRKLFEYEIGILPFASTSWCNTSSSSNTCSPSHRPRKRAGKTGRTRHCRRCSRSRMPTKRWISIYMEGDPSADP